MITINDVADELGIKIRCIIPDAPERLQMFLGWTFIYDGKAHYTSGGATKAEIINHIVAKRSAKINALDKIKTMWFYQ